MDRVGFAVVTSVDSLASPVKEFQRSSTIATMTPDEPDIPEPGDLSSDLAKPRSAWPGGEGDSPKRCTSGMSADTLGFSEAETSLMSSAGSHFQNLEIMMVEVSDLADVDEEEQEEAFDGNNGDDDIDGIVIEGPLEQLNFLSLWRPRWCVLTSSEFRVYRSREASRRHPFRPKQTIRMDVLDVEIRRETPTRLVCYNTSRGDRPAAVLRSGKGFRWEEWACARLWLAKIASVI
mmetsp:Transcript_97326/g.280119  ORF Transcript_97326/g.280119 Transcript_97326/m.280119 type:complete len:234 (+) Transcript_97326:87-788(+)